jgi:predicted amidohydrolase YtcJ
MSTSIRAGGATPTLAVVNARIWTGERRQPWADALAARDDRLVAVGSSAAVRKLVRPSTREIDAQGAMIVPGFIDSHIHFLEGGVGLSSVQLRGVTTRAEFVRRIAEFATTVPAGTWITNGDWDHEAWGGELPRREWIDAVTPAHPVWLARHDHHMSLANGVALRLAGVTRDTPDGEGGVIARDAAGDPTGILKDNAEQLVDRVLPPLSAGAERRALEAAMRYVAAHGVTSVQHVGTWEDLAAFERLQAAGALNTRIHAAVPLATWERLRDRVAEHGRGDDWLRIGGLKGFVDGSLGSHTAAMLEPYRDLPSDVGLLVNTPDDLRRWTTAADAAGLHVMVHAIGDRANRLQLDIFESVIRAHGSRDRRFRIEHAQHLAAADIARFAALGVIASVQPYHVIDDGRWAERVIGHDRATRTYAFRALLDAGTRLAMGSDWPIAPATPLEGIYAAVTRSPLDGTRPDGWIPEQRISVEEALRGYTIDAAFASFAERDAGSLARGKLADFALLDRDLTPAAPDELRRARVVMTVVGGRVVHDARSNDTPRPPFDDRA